MLSYILITPIKDEEQNLNLLKISVINQILKPKLWVIVDSFSSDNSFEAAEELFKDYEWIHVIKQKNLLEKGYGHINFAQAINEGYKYAKNCCEEKKIIFKYIGKLDAAVSLKKDYYKILIEEMENNSNLAFVCGILHVVLENNKKIINKPSARSKTMGVQDIRIYNKDFFEEMDGYPLNFSPDTILLIKAINRGWDFKVIQRTYYEKKRLGGTGGSKIRVWSAYKLKGKAMYTLGYDFIFVFFNSLYNSYKYPPHYQAIASIYGYILCSIKKENKIDDKEVIEYFGKRLSKNLKFMFHINLK